MITLRFDVMLCCAVFPLKYSHKLMLCKMWAIFIWNTGELFFFQAFISAMYSFYVFQTFHLVFSLVGLKISPGLYVTEKIFALAAMHVIHVTLLVV